MKIVSISAVAVGPTVHLLGLGKDDRTYTWDFLTGEWKQNWATEEQKAEVAEIRRQQELEFQAQQNQPQPQKKQSKRR